ncbi:MAG: hypothetical protein GY856_25520, partial [bacterium]|nr:hypothetical protein [bacterium]
MALFSKSLEEQNTKIREKLATGAFTPQDLEKLTARIRKELAAKKPDAKALDGAFDLLIETARRAPNRLGKVPIVEVLTELLEQPGMVQRRENRLFSWACQPESWMPRPLVDYVCREAWRESLGRQDGSAALALALTLRRTQPQLFKQLKGQERLSELLRRVRAALPRHGRKKIAGGLESGLARMVLPAAACKQLPDCAWRLALVLEAAAANDRDTPAFLRELAALIDGESDVERLAWMLSAPWTDAFPDAAGELEPEILVKAAQRLLRITAGEAPEHDRRALERLASSRPAAVVEFLDSLIDRGFDELLRTAVEGAAAALEVPAPDAAAGLGSLPEAGAQRFLVAWFLFFSSDLAARAAARYVEVLAALAGSREELERARGTVAAKLEALAPRPADWDLLAWTAARALSGKGKSAVAYRRFIELCPPAVREPILTQVLAEGDGTPEREKLTALAAGWRPSAGNDELQVRICWRLARHGADAEPGFLTPAAKAMPEYALVRSALALGRHDLLEAESRLRQTRSGEPMLADSVAALSWREQWGELAEQADRWAAGELAVTGPQAELCLALSRIRLQENDPGGALLALARHLAATEEPVAETEPGLDELLAAEGPEADVLLEAAGLLAPCEQHAAACLRIVELALRVYGERVAEAADGLLDALLEHRLPTPVARAVALARVRLPLTRRDAAEKLRRLREVHEREELPPKMIAEEAWSLPVEVLAGEEEFLWGLEVFLSQRWHQRTLERYDELSSPDLRAKALERLFAAVADMSVKSQVEVATRWLSLHAPSEDPTGLWRGVEWLIRSFEALPKDRTVELIRQGLGRLAELGDVAAVSCGIAFLNGLGRFGDSLDLLGMLLDQENPLPEENLDLYFAVCRELEDPATRRHLVFRLARFYESQSPPAALWLFVAYFEQEGLSEGRRREDNATFQDELAGFTARPGGAGLAGAHVLEAQSRFTLGEPESALESLRQAFERGGDQALRPLLERLLAIPDDALHAEVLELKVRVRNRLGEPVLDDVRALLGCLEKIASADDLESRRQRLLALEEELGEARARAEDPDEELGWATISAWVADLGSPPTSVWEAYGGRFRFGALVERLQRRPQASELGWLQARLVDRAGELDPSLLVPLFELLCAAGREEHGPNLYRYVSVFRQREDIDLETVRAALDRYLDAAERLGLDEEAPHWWRLEADLDAGDAAAAVRHARGLLAGDGRRRTRVLELVARFRSSVLQPQASWEGIWQLVPELFVDLDPDDDPARWFELALACLRRLAGLGRGDEATAATADVFQRHCAGLGEDAAGIDPREAALATAILEFQAGRIGAARKLWIELLSDAAALERGPVDGDPLAAYGIARPAEATAWGSVLLKLLDELAQRLGSAGKPADPGRIDEARYTLAVLCEPPELTTAIAAIRGLRNAGDTFLERYSEGLTELIDELARRREDPWPDVRELALISLKVEHLLEREQHFEAAVELLRPLVPQWSGEGADGDGDETVLRSLRRAMADVGTAAISHLPLMLLRLDLELSLARLTEDWTRAEALTATFPAREFPGLEQRLLGLCREHPEALALVRRFARDDGSILPALVEGLATVGD